MLKEYTNEWMDERMNTLPNRTLETWEASLPYIKCWGTRSASVCSDTIRRSGISILGHESNLMMMVMMMIIIFTLNIYFRVLEPDHLGFNFGTTI